MGWRRVKMSLKIQEKKEDIEEQRGYTLVQALIIDMKI